MNNKKDIVICIEGPDGSGKTTQAKLLANCFKLNNIKAKYTREPGGTPLGENIRQLFLSHFPSLTTIDQILLINIARNSHIKNIILPALAHNYIIILDRFFLSTLVYQGKGEPLNIALINYLHKTLFSSFTPSLTIVLDIEVKTALKRISQRTFNNSIDDVPLSKHINIKKLYEETLSIYEAPFIKLNTNEKDIEQLHNIIVDNINKIFNLNLNPLSKEIISIILEKKNLPIYRHVLKSQYSS